MNHSVLLQLDGHYAYNENTNRISVQPELALYYKTNLTGVLSAVAWKPTISLNNINPNAPIHSSLKSSSIKYKLCIQNLYYVKVSALKSAQINMQISISSFQFQLIISQS